VAASAGERGVGVEGLRCGLRPARCGAGCSPSQHALAVRPPGLTAFCMGMRWRFCRSDMRPSTSWGRARHVRLVAVNVVAGKLSTFRKAGDHSSGKPVDTGPGATSRPVETTVSSEGEAGGRDHCSWWRHAASHYCSRWGAAACGHLLQLI
jgi:hypothetical protein